MRKVLEYGGIAAGVVLILFGIGAIALSVQGKNTVKDSLADEHIVDSPDMPPDAITAEADKAGLETVAIPSCSVCAPSPPASSRMRRAGTSGPSNGAGR